MVRLDDGHLARAARRVEVRRDVLALKERVLRKLQQTADVVATVAFEEVGDALRAVVGAAEKIAVSQVGMDDLQRDA
jgi:hypothetical protein